MPHILVVGGGWAGLACAYQLCKAKHQVTLIEAAPQLGGRARSVAFQDYIIDNGQHVGMGAYRSMRSLIHELGLREADLFQILPLEISSLGSKAYTLKFAKLPAPFNLLVGLFTSPQLPWHMKIQILKFAMQLKKIDFILPQDCSLHTCLKNYHQSDMIIDLFWEPIALAIMTTPIATASAQVFLNVLRQVFYKQREDSNWYLPKVDLTNVLPKHLAQFLQQSGCEIILNHNIQEVKVADATCKAVASNSKTWQADHVVLAMPPWRAKNLLQPHLQLQQTYSTLDRFEFVAITTVYLIFEQPIRLPYPVLGLQNSNCQWLCSSIGGSQENIISAVISGELAPALHDKSLLFTAVLQEIRRHFPWLPQPISYKIISEKRAAFECNVATQAIRPQPQTEIANLWLTGDYLATGLPSTLEGALLSGMMTAKAVLEEDISPRSNHNC